MDTTEVLDLTLLDSADVKPVEQQQLEHLIVRLYEVRGSRLAKPDWLGQFEPQQRELLKRVLGGRLNGRRRVRRSASSSRGATVRMF